MQFFFLESNSLFKVLGMEFLSQPDTLNFWLTWISTSIQCFPLLSMVRKNKVLKYYYTWLFIFYHPHVCWSKNNTSSEILVSNCYLTSKYFENKVYQLIFHIPHFEQSDHFVSLLQDAERILLLNLVPSLWLPWLIYHRWQQSKLIWSKVFFNQRKNMDA